MRLSAPIATPEGRSIEGMSMGANGALKLAFKYPELFHSVVAYAGSYKRLPLDGYFPSIAAGAAGVDREAQPVVLGR